MEIVYSENVKLEINLTERMVRDHEECERLADIVGGDGKDCSTCSLNVDIEGSGLCDLPTVRGELERRKESCCRK